MIAGDLEKEIQHSGLLQDHEYDEFGRGLFKRKDKKAKKKLTAAERAERRENTKNTLKDIGDFGATLSDTIRAFRPQPPTDQQDPISFNAEWDDGVSENKEDQPKDQANENYALIGLGIIIAVLVGIGIYKKTQETNS